MVVLDTPQMTGRPAQMMGFMDAVKNVLLNNYVNFDGRASRSEYWWWVLATIPMSFPFFILDVTVFGWGIEDPTWFQNIFAVAIFLPGLGVVFRRLHDSGRSGWWLLIGLIPCVGFIVLIVFLAQDGEPYPNQYGEVPTNILPTD
tara:strand:- start:40 stop:474 length:435 start_codon:yes stop_codon:yes gene_type:complete